MNLCPSLSVIVNQSFDQGKAYREPYFPVPVPVPRFLFLVCRRDDIVRYKSDASLFNLQGPTRSNSGTSHCLPRNWNARAYGAVRYLLRGHIFHTFNNKCCVGWAPRTSGTNGTLVPNFLLATSSAFPSVVAEARNRVAKQLSETWMP
jgi:hypothetical protein